MGLYLKMAAGLLLLVHLASLQDSTDSPGRTIDKSWLRDRAENTAGSQNATVSKDEADNDQGHGGMVSGSSIGDEMESDVMTPNTDEEKNVASQVDTTETSTDPSTVTEPPTSSPTTLQTEQPNPTISPNPTATTVPTKASRINGTEAEEEFPSSTTTTSQISTTHLSERNSTILPDNANRTDSQATTLAPGNNATQEPTTKPDEVTRSTNATESTTATTTAKQGMNETTAPAFPSETTTTSPATTTTAAPITPGIANRTDTDAASGSSSGRGLGEDSMNSKRNGAWVAILGLGLAVILIGLVAHVILKKKNRKGFSHRKLVEEYPSDPVLRLDNGTPLDLNIGRGGSAYYNPSLQADNIQMSNFPGNC